MKKQVYLTCLLLILAGYYSTSKAQTNWYTQEVSRELGYEVKRGTPAIPFPFQTWEYKLKNCRIVSGTVAVFDTVTTYAQGWVVNATTYKPVKAALVQVTYSCFGYENLCEVKTAIIDSEGFFRLGWVGCGGPSGGRTNRPLSVKAVGYQPIVTQQVDFGGAAYLHIELSPTK